MSEIQADLHTFIAYRVREGFESEDQILENAMAHAQESYSLEIPQAEVEQLVAELLAAHRAEQATWELPTDCDRLDQAFAALNQRDIVARQDFSCCTACGHLDIWDEITEVEKKQPVEGYVFYHFQCTEQAMESGRLMMAFGSVADDWQSLEDVAYTIVQELIIAGLDAKWKGCVNSAIIVEGLVWRRRR